MPQFSQPVKESRSVPNLLVLETLLNDHASRLSAQEGKEKMESYPGSSYPPSTVKPFYMENGSSRRTLPMTDDESSFRTDSLESFHASVSSIPLEQDSTSNNVNTNNKSRSESRGRGRHLFQEIASRSESLGRTLSRKFQKEETADDDEDDANIPRPQPRRSSFVDLFANKSSEATGDHSSEGSTSNQSPTPPPVVRSRSRGRIDRKEKRQTALEESLMNSMALMEAEQKNALEESKIKLSTREAAINTLEKALAEKSQTIDNLRAELQLLRSNLETTEARAKKAERALARSRSPSPVEPRGLSSRRVHKDKKEKKKEKKEAKEAKEAARSKSRGNRDAMVYDDDSRRQSHQPQLSENRRSVTEGRYGTHVPLSRHTSFVSDAGARFRQKEMTLGEKFREEERRTGSDRRAGMSSQRSRRSLESTPARLQESRGSYGTARYGADIRSLAEERMKYSRDSNPQRRTYSDARSLGEERNRMTSDAPMPSIRRPQARTLSRSPRP